MDEGTFWAFIAALMAAGFAWMYGSSKAIDLILKWWDAWRRR